jgi:hypothetical protein
MKPRFSFLVIVVLLAFSACKKDVPQPNQPALTVPEKFNDLTVGNDFTWGTLQKVTILFDGYTAPVNVQRPLSVFLPNSSVAIYTANFSLNAAALIKVEAPANVTELVVQYGAITKRIPISNNMVFSPKPEFE